MTPDRRAPSAADEPTVTENLARIRERIARAAARSGRWPDEIRLIAVTKTVQAARVAEAVRAGVTEFGENYVQEARAKIPAVNDAASEPLAWHFIGHLQSNKAKYCVGLFSLIHSVDNYQLAQEISQQALKRSITQPVLIEVRLSDEASRAGVGPQNVPELAEKVSALPNLRLDGLMGLPPFGESPEAARPHFQALRTLFEGLPALNQRVLSMGMSGDFEVAIEEGATMIRLGTALFGQRSSSSR